MLPAMLVLLLAILIFTAVGNAQNPQDETGTVRGAVVTAGPDGQSYNIPGATVRLKRNVQFAETIANDAGGYEFTNISPGDYLLEASSEGFKAGSKPITIHTGELLLENISLEVADVTASVTVASDVENVQTTEAAPATTFKQNTLKTLPLPREQLVDALPFVPGVVRG
ncbi:MAG TPA: carboxypeptidase-like regulatory domain-containing protein, partial [Pyrinomonadaceae bacterium]|nr:carboxypeptidase-like regulatory domain-containing protein [Pyrinomonadaceae bacterium]